MVIRLAWCVCGAILCLAEEVCLAQLIGEVFDGGGWVAYHGFTS